MEPKPSVLKTKLPRAALIVFCILAILVIAYFALNSMLPGFFHVLEKGDEAAIEDYIRSCGTGRGMLIAFLLQFFQIVSIFFPGGPIQIAIGIVFGTWLGFLICHVGYIAANAAVFLLARKLGGRMVASFANSNKKSKLAFIKESKHPAFVVGLACLMPFLPNGLVPYVAAMTRIRFWAYLIAVWAGSFPSLLLLCAIGGRLLKGDYLAAALFCLLLVFGVALLCIFRKRLFALADRIAARFQKNENI